MKNVLILAISFCVTLSELAPTVTPRTLIYNFDHCSSQAFDALDPEQIGQEGALRYYHIITPLKKNDHVMYRFDLIGYAYGVGLPLDLTWVGYNYNK